MKILEVDTDTNQRFISTGLYHGSTSQEKVLYFRPREREQPLDTLIIWHNYIKEESNKKFGINIRDLLFTINSKDGIIHQNLYSVYVSQPVSFYIVPAVDDMTLYYDLDAGSLRHSIKNEVLKNNIKSPMIIDGILKDIPFDNAQFIKRSISTTDDFIEYVTKLIETKGIDVGKIRKSLELVVKNTKKRIDAYINSVREVSLDDIKNLKNMSEVMIRSNKVKLVQVD